MITINTSLPNFASAQSTSMDFDSYAEMGGKYYAANENGIFRINQSAGEINAYFSMPKIALKGLSRFNWAKIRYFSEGSLYLKITVDDNFLRTIVFPPVASERYHENTIPFPYDLVGCYFQTEIGNVEGCYFSIDTIEIDVSALFKKPIGTPI